MKTKKTLKRVFLVCTVLILLLTMIYSGLRILESTVLRQGQDGASTYASKIITRNGVNYYPRQDITVIMILGIDEFGPVQASKSYRNPGEADMVALLILDRADESYSLLCLNRDTMLEMPVLGLGGKQAGTYFGQLALAHTYGSGLEDSCENIRTTVSNFLLGIPIDYYVAMNMDAISMLNDAVGGVTVTVSEDDSLPQGQVTLYGQQALTFVRTRKDVGSQLNLSRMERQRDYFNGFMKSLGEKLDSDLGFALNTYDQVSDYIVTDCSGTQISTLMDQCSDYRLKEIVSPEGENVLGEQFYEFYVDEEKLDELALRLFFVKR